MEGRNRTCDEVLRQAIRHRETAGSAADDDEIIAALELRDLALEIGVGYVRRARQSRKRHDDGHEETHDCMSQRRAMEPSSKGSWRFQEFILCRILRPLYPSCLNSGWVSHGFLRRQYSLVVRTLCQSGRLLLLGSG